MTMPEPGPDAGLDEIQADIEKTREQLGQTVEALSAKLDVKAQARHKVEETKAQARQKVDHTKARAVETVHTAQEKAAQAGPALPAAAILALAAVVGLIIWRRRRR